MTLGKLFNCPEPVFSYLNNKVVRLEWDKKAQGIALHGAAGGQGGPITSSCVTSISRGWGVALGARICASSPGLFPETSVPLGQVSSCPPGGGWGRLCGQDPGRESLPCSLELTASDERLRRDQE